MSVPNTSSGLLISNLSPVFLYVILAPAPRIAIPAPSAMLAVAAPFASLITLSSTVIEDIFTSLPKTCKLPLISKSLTTTDALARHISCLQIQKH